MTDNEFIEAFEACTLPFDQWTHRAHVRVAYVYLDRYGLEAGIDRMRVGIKAYNAANSVPEGPLVGYNETTTVAFAHIVYAVMRAYAQSHPVDGSEAFCDMHPQLMSSRVLRLFYSPQRRGLPEAKAVFVEPDLAPLPRVQEGVT